MPIPTHLTEQDYNKNFPAGPDEFPEVRNEEHYIDAWLINTAYDSLMTIEQYLLLYKANIEAPLGDNITGENGQLEIQIPSACYPPGKTATASDTNLKSENIVKGQTIFGVVGSAEGGYEATLNLFAATNEIKHAMEAKISYEEIP